MKLWRLLYDANRNLRQLSKRRREVISQYPLTDGNSKAYLFGLMDVISYGDTGYTFFLPTFILRKTKHGHFPRITFTGIPCSAIFIRFSPAHIAFSSKK